MEYCPQCNSLLLPQRRGKQVILKCKKCGFEKTLHGKNTLKDRYILKKKIEHKPEEKIIVLEKEFKVGVKVPAKCPKCGYNEAYYYEQQTRSADEPTTRFFMCVKCGYKWREYD